MTKIIMMLAQGMVSTPQLIQIMGYSSKTGNFKVALKALLQSGMIEMTIPDKPRSKNQKYRLTVKGRRYIKNHE